MRKLSIIFILAMLLSASCKPNEGKPLPTGYVLNPSELTIERTGQTSVQMKWKDNSTNEKGFAIFLGSSAATASDLKQIALLQPDQTVYDINEGLEEGKSYVFGVQAKGEQAIFDSKTISESFTLIPLSEAAIPSLTSQAQGNDVCISVSYEIGNFKKCSSYGLCWSSEGTPTIEDMHQSGPLSEDGGEMLQVIPNALLSYGETYKIRAYAVSEAGTFYSSETSASLGNEAAPITLNWTELDFPSLPEEIKVYETTEALEGKNFHAWYAIADLSTGKVEMRTSVPQNAQTIDDQAKAAEGCCVMVNGGYFYNGRNTGLSIVKGVTSGSIGAVRGSLKTADSEYNEMYNITRGIFGTDAEGTPAVYWAGTDASSQSYFYDRPLPSVKGEAKYGVPSKNNPSAAVDWSFEYALSAGPVLLYDGKCPFDFTTTSSGDDYYLSNYEIIPYDIFGTGVTPDRTAAGFTEDGKIILFICDGRISQSNGATLVQLSRIMKGLGCKGAVNFDGGGSTGMVVCGQHLNDMSSGNRAVMSTIGLFVK